LVVAVVCWWWYGHPPTGDATDSELSGPHVSIEEDNYDYVEDFGELEMGEEEELDNDPVLPDHDLDLDFEAANDNIEEAEGARPRPHAEIVDLDSGDERMDVNVAGPEVAQASSSREAPPAAVPPVTPVPPVSMDVLVRRQQPGRRRDQHHDKSFVFGMFFVKYRDDQSMLYPDKIPSWTVSCPVHDK
jgi:hypothetical protein